MEEKHWKNEELRKWEEALPRLREYELEKVSKVYKAKTGVGCCGFHSKVLLDLSEETRRTNCGVLGEGGAEWNMAATSLHDDVLLNTEGCCA